FELASPILAAAFVQALMLSAIFILLPLLAGNTAQGGTGLTARTCGYFFSIGLAFLFIEIAFIQKFILFLSHPLYAVTVVLAGFLFFAGLGSSFASYLVRHEKDAFISFGITSASAISFSTIGITVISFCYLWFLPEFFANFTALFDIWRIFITLSLIAPLAFFMGLPFPLALARLDNLAPRLIPWAWAVNGCASVVSAILATLLAMEIGFALLLALACLLYLCSGFLFIPKKPSV
ncbi:MAG: hypothetical protein R3245_12435, partial [Kiloniellales bacterium]|nr:hypothetical protein [Kiloniellales bacterium]